MAPEPLTNKPPSLAAQVSRAVVWNTLFVPLRMLAEIFATLIRLNVLSQASYGFLALVSGAASGLGTGIDLGTTRALPKYIPETSRSGGPRAVLRLLTVVLAAQVVVLALVGIGLMSFSQNYLAGLRQKVLEDLKLTNLDQAALIQFIGDYGWLVIATILVMLFLGVCYDMLMAYLNSFFKQRIWNSIALAAGVLPPLLSAGAILAGWDILGVLVAMMVAPAIAVTVAAWNVARLWMADLRLAVNETATITPGSQPQNWLPPSFLRYCSVSFLMTITDYIASAQFAVFLAQDISDVALLWAGAAVVRMVLAYLYTPMVGIQVPLFARVRAGEGGTLLQAYQSLIRLQVLLLLPGGIGLLLLAQPVLVVISPEVYLGAIPLVWVLAPSLFLESLLTTAHNALIVYERLRIIIISRLLTLVVVVPLAIWLPQTLGLLGVALAFGLARLAAGFWVTASGYRLLGLRWPWRFTLRVLAASGMMALLILSIRGLLPPIPESLTLTDRLREAALLLLVVGVGAATFLAALRMTGGLEPQDREQLAKLRLPLKRWILRIL
jgi:O-antigen/teichoic acid export membrane protein